MKKITFLMLHLNYGGLEKQTITLINQLAKNSNYKIEIISVYDMLNGKSFYEIDSKVKIRFLSKFGPNHKALKEACNTHNIAEILKQSFIMIKCWYYKFIKMKKAINKCNTDILVSTRIEFAKMIKRHDTLNVTQEHSYKNDESYIRKIKKSFNNIDYVIVMTNKAKEDYENYLRNSKAKVTLIPNMIEKLEIDKKADFTNKVLISVGRLEKEKDFISMLEVFKIVHLKDKSLKLKIIGEGTERKALEEKINELELNGYVELPGRMESKKINQELTLASVFLLTSNCESFSLVICEAMRVGLPVISFDIEVGPREIITNRENGILVENKNKGKMAEEILNLLNSKKEWSKISNNSTENVKKYYDFNVVKEWEKIFEGENV